MARGGGSRVIEENLGNILEAESLRPQVMD